LAVGEFPVVAFHFALEGFFPQFEFILRFLQSLQLDLHFIMLLLLFGGFIDFELLPRQYLILPSQRFPHFHQPLLVVLQLLVIMSFISTAGPLGFTAIATLVVGLSILLPLLAEQPQQLLLQSDLIG
jgi:hypothetical protein